MKISYKWLKDYLSIDLQPGEVSDILTSIGLEVEGVEEIESIKGGLKGFVIGEVLTCAQHPNADKLSVTTVNVGEREPLNIVCGAPNVAAGQKVVVATVGTTLYNGDDSFVIKKAKLRGEPSEGMICAEDELGIGESHDGILVLDTNAQPGTKASEFFNIESDTVFEIGLTPNRIDAASHYGVARDLAAYLAQNQNVELKLPDVSAFKEQDNSYPVKVSIENTDGCNRYCGVTIKDVAIAPSSEWLQVKLKAIGLNPINNVVDITNFVLHELGQPLHAFDADKLNGKEIIVKTLAKGTKFTTLDEVEHELTNEDLMICDASGPVAMAGIFGGLHSGVTQGTKNIFLESAYFNPVFVRKTSRLHSTFTDSSFRFERGADPNITVYALKRAALLIQELAGGVIASEVTDNYPVPLSNHKVQVKYSNVHRLIGKELPKDTIKSILSSLEIKILNETDEELSLEVPAYRVDVTREADVIEEILRIYGYNNIEITEKLNSTISYPAKPDREKVLNTLSDYLVSSGFNEIMSNSLTRSDYYSPLTTFPQENLVKVLNPISSDLDCMRQTLLFNGLEAIRHNLNRQQFNLKLFEFGSGYYLNTKNQSPDVLKKYSEKEYISLFITGNKEEKSWNTAEQTGDFYYLKSYVENVLKLSGFSIDEIQYSDVPDDIFDDGITYSYNNKQICTLGIVNSKIRSALDIDETVYFAEINCESIMKQIGSQKIEFKEMPKYPEVRRDLALLLDNAVTFSELKDIAYKVEKKILKSVQLFDVYTGKNIPEGKKSYGISFVLQDENQTLNDKRIDKIMQQMQNEYVSKLDAVIR